MQETILTERTRLVFWMFVLIEHSVRINVGCRDSHAKKLLRFHVTYERLHLSGALTLE